MAHVVGSGNSIVMAELEIEKRKVEETLRVIGCQDEELKRRGGSVVNIVREKESVVTEKKEKVSVVSVNNRRVKTKGRRKAEIIKRSKEMMITMEKMAVEWEKGNREYDTVLMEDVVRLLNGREKEDEPRVRKGRTKRRINNTKQDGNLHVAFKANSEEPSVSREVTDETAQEDQHGCFNSQDWDNLPKH